MDVIFLGIKSHAVCINKTTGDELWRTKLGTNWGSVTNVQLEGDTVIAYSNGVLYALSAASGNIKWKNKLKGLGHSYCIIAGKDSAQQAAVHYSASADGQRAAAAGGGS
jgi:hypothetical protein